MKKLFTLVAAALLTVSISSSAFAHSHLAGSNPADGEVVTTPLNEIVLEFEGKIEQGSFMDVKTTSGQAVEMQELTISEGTLTGTVANPLPNNEYQVNWSIISSDGHPSEGAFSFTVNAPVPEAVVEPAKSAEVVEETTGATEQSAQELEAAPADDVKEKETSSSTVIFIAILVVIVAAGIFFFTRRKK